MQEPNFRVWALLNRVPKYLRFNNPRSDKLKEGKDIKERKQEIREQGMKKKQQGKRETHTHFITLLTVFS